MLIKMIIRRIFKYVHKAKRGYSPSRDRNLIS